MKIYTVHIRRPIIDPDRDVVLIKEGFSWPAFLVSVLWALWHRLWLVAAGMVAVHVAWQVVSTLFGIDPLTRTLVDLALSIGIGVIANDLRRWTLQGRAYVEAGVVSGDDSEFAAERFLDQRPDLRAELSR